jgi:hypothetical protein
VSDPEPSQQRADRSIQLLVWAIPQARSPIPPILLILPWLLTRIGFCAQWSPLKAKAWEFDATGDIRRRNLADTPIHGSVTSYSGLNIWCWIASIPAVFRPMRC